MLVMTLNELPLSTDLGRNESTRMLRCTLLSTTDATKIKLQTMERVVCYTVIPYFDYEESGTKFLLRHWRSSHQEKFNGIRM